MKTIYKYSLLLAATFFILSGCGELSGTDSDTEPEPSEETVTLRLKSAGAESDARTAIDAAGMVSWNQGDMVYINGEAYGVMPLGEDPTCALVEGVRKSTEYIASYPDPLYETPEGYYEVMIPCNQDYYTDEYYGTYGISANPMIAYGTDEELDFSNIGAVLSFGITGNAAVTGISVTSNDGSPMAGPVLVPRDEVFSLSYSDRFTLSSSAESKRIYLGGFMEELDAFEETLFYLVTAPEAYPDGFTVYVRDDAGNVAIQSTYNSGDLYRGMLVQKEPFEFVPAAGPEIVIADATENMLIYEVHAPQGVYLKTAVILKSAMDAAEEAGLATFAYDILCSSGSEAEIVWEESMRGFSTSTAWDSDMNRVSIEPDTDYVIVAAYSDSEEVFVSTVTDADAHTAGDSGPEPSQGGISTEDFTIGDELQWQ